MAIRRYLPRSISNISGIPFIASDPVSSILPLRDGTGSEKIWRTPNQRCEEIRSKRQRKSLIEQSGAETLLASERKLSSSSEVIIGTRRRRRKTQHRLILLHLSGGRERERERERERVAILPRKSPLGWSGGEVIGHQKVEGRDETCSFLNRHCVLPFLPVLRRHCRPLNSLFCASHYSRIVH